MRFELNGRLVDVEVPADTPLLWVIREHLDLVGTKFGCGMALCGACTVHLDGGAVRSCVTPAGSVQGRKVTTIEGLAAASPASGEAGLHPVQRAWEAENVPQCGYCQPGQMMQAASLLAHNPTPSDAEIEAAMSGNICRCGTYPRIRKAIKRVVAEGKGVAK